MEFERNFKGCKICRDAREGTEIVSPSGRHYEVFELVSFKGTTTADIIIAIEITNHGYGKTVSYTFGADEGGLEYLIDDILEYEKTNVPNDSLDLSIE